MGRLSTSVLALILSGACAMALSSCGSGKDAKLLPGSTASQIESNLDQVKQLVADGDCVGAEDTVAAVTAEVEELNDVATKLKSALREGTAKLSEVVSRCEEEAEVEAAEPEPEPDVEAEELEEDQLKAEEKAEKATEKAEEKTEKAEAKEEEQAEGPEVEEGTLPPQAEGKAKGHEESAAPAPAPETPAESPSGGVGPAVGAE